MKILRKSPFSGRLIVREINVTSEQLANWEKGMSIQRAMPHLSADDREFLETGISPEEWDETFKG